MMLDRLVGSTNYVGLEAGQFELPVPMLLQSVWNGCRRRRWSQRWRGGKWERLASWWLARSGRRSD